MLLIVILITISGKSLLLVRTFPVAYLKYDKLIIEGEVYEYDPTVEDIVSVRK